MNSGPYRLLTRLVRTLRGRQLSRSVDAGGGSVEVADPWHRVRILKGPGSQLSLNGVLRVNPHLGGRERTIISLAPGARLEIAGDFALGHGVVIAVAQGASLRIGGRSVESGSGITSDSRILVQRRVEVGTDFVCAWGVLITDCDWHQIEGRAAQADVHIGDHVWVAHDVSILKGARIGAGSIVAGRSVVSSSEAPPGSLLAGAPARVVRTGVAWRRDLGVGT